MIYWRWAMGGRVALEAAERAASNWLNTGVVSSMISFVNSIEESKESKN